MMFRNLRFDEAKNLLGGPVTPEPDEERNGWNTESLTIYIAEKRMAEGGKVLDKPDDKPKGTTTRMKWLRR